MANVGRHQSHIEMASSLNTWKSEIRSAHFHDRKAIMKTFDVQAISLYVSQQQAFTFIADAKHLPDWAQAFASVDGKRALMRTPLR